MGLVGAGIGGCEFCAHNPTGLGYCRGLPIDGLPLPQIEWPDQLITRPSDKPTPAGFGCYARTWQPRVRFLGKFDANKLNQGGIQTKMPKSFSAQAWNCAHPLMQFKRENVVAGTSIQLLNLSQAGELSLRIPRVKPTISIVSAEHERSAFTPAFDTITIEPNLGHFAMTWRHTFDVGPAHPKIQTVEVHA